MLLKKVAFRHGHAQANSFVIPKRSEESAFRRQWKPTEKPCITNAHKQATEKGQSGPFSNHEL
jgi:hypothetical protein